MRKTLNSSVGNLKDCSCYSKRGQNQAWRNSSKSIWAIFSDKTTDFSLTKGTCQYCQEKGRCQNCGCMLDKTSTTIKYQEQQQNSRASQNQKINKPNTNIRYEKQRQNSRSIQKETRQNITSKNQADNSKNLATTKAQTQFVRSKNSNNRVSFLDSDFGKKQQNKLSKDKAKSLEKSAYKKSYKKFKKSIEKYLNELRPCSRQLPNSAFSKFYEKPIAENYGSKNTNSIESGVVYSNYLKTHNIQPHLGQNNPKKYQTYHSALQFAKRAKVDPDDRLLRIYRQITKKINANKSLQEIADGFIDLEDTEQPGQNSYNVKQALKLNISKLKGQKIERSSSAQATTGQRSKSFEKLNATKTTNIQTTMQTRANNDLNNSQIGSPRLNGSKSLSSMNNRKSFRQPFYIYRYKNKDGDTIYAKDRHGLTCYVDPSFPENQEAFTKFLKSRRPIEADDVRSEDKNIDRIRIQNYLESKQQQGTQQQWPKHYLKPVVNVPGYNPQKYQSWKKKKQPQNINIDRVKQEA